MPRQTPESNNNNEDYLTYLTKAFTSLTGENIPKSFTSTKFSKPWLDKNCKNATLWKFKLNPTKENNFKNSRAKVWQTITKAKQTSWTNYISKINMTVKPKMVCDMIKKIVGVCENFSTTLKLFNQNNKP